MLAPATVVPVRLVVVVGLVIAIVAPRTKFVPKIATDWLFVTPYVTAAGLSDPIVGCGAVTVKPPTRLTVSPPAAAGFVTVTVYAPGSSAVFGHQNRSVPLLLYT